MAKPAALTALTLLWILFAPFANAQSTSPPAVAPGVVLVKFSPDLASGTEIRLNIQALPSTHILSLLQQANATQAEKVFSDFMPSDVLSTHRTTGENVHLIDVSRWYRIHVPEGTDVIALAQSLAEQPGIEAASPDYIGHVADTEPNDELYESGLQWGLSNSQNPGRDIHAPQAWDYNTGRNDVIVAVLDSGVDYNHDDLDPGNRSRVIAGWDINGDGDPMDSNGPNQDGGHGTSVAGSLGAITNNNLQAAGIMWNLQIMPVKVIATNGNANNSYVAGGLDYARSHGADIVNMSLNIDGPDIPEWWAGLTPMVDAAVNAYREGVAIFASSGNGNLDVAQYPAGYPFAMAVGATDQNDVRSSFSNFGSHLDVVAPGQEYHTLARYGGTREFGGTSLSSPLAAGVGGLVLSEGRDRGLNLTNDDIYWILRLSADDVNGDDYPGFDEFIGHGRVNAEAALTLLNPPNVFSHVNRTGGSSVQTQGSHTRIFTGGHYGDGLYLAAGHYHGVRQYKVTGHVFYGQTYVAPPLVWAREREIKGWGSASPNSQSPWINITNVTTTGFDYETYVYFIAYNDLGQSINTYVPASPSQVVTAFSVVGELAPLNASITGPTSLPSGQSGTWTSATSGGQPPYNYLWQYLYPCPPPPPPCAPLCRTGEARTAMRFPAESPGEALRGRDIPARETCGQWLGGSTGFSFTKTFTESTVTIRLTVTDAASTVDTATHAVTLTGGAQGGGEQSATTGPASDAMASTAESGAVPAEPSLTGVRPNPFNPVTVVQFSLPEAQEARIAVYDMLGREVAVLTESRLDAGPHEVHLDAGSLPSGVYLVRMVAGAHVSTQRITLLR